MNHPAFGRIVDFEALRSRMPEVYGRLYPEFNVLNMLRKMGEIAQGDNSIAIAAGASFLAYSILLAAEEFELAGQLQDKIFTLGWTEEHCGSDLLSIRTQATPLSDAPDERQYHISGRKWLINNSFHADYHLVLAKVDPTQDGPRSLSFFLVPHSATRNWERLETHVLQNMVLTTYEIDGPGTLVGKVGHGLSIVQRMALPAKFECSYVGLEMLKESIPATVEHLTRKRIFGEHPVNFSNVFRQLYNLALQTALMHFMWHRALVLGDDGWLAFHGALLKSFLLLRVNDILSANLLVAGSKGFLKTSPIGGDAFDSFVLPVFDGHYTINTLMNAKHAAGYVNATQRTDLGERLARLRAELFCEKVRDEIYTHPLEVRKPPFFDYTDYLTRLAPPLDLQPQRLVAQVRHLLAELDRLELSRDADHRYKTGDLIHWLESLLAACELWVLSGEDHYLNLIIQQYNSITRVFNVIVSEGGLDVPFMTPLRQSALPQVDDPAAFLLRLSDPETILKQAFAANAAPNGHLTALA